MEKQSILRLIKYNESEEINGISQQVAFAEDTTFRIILRSFTPLSLGCLDEDN